MEDMMILRAQLEGLMLQEQRIQEAIAATRTKLGQPEAALQIVASRYTTGNPADPLPDIPAINSGKRQLSIEARSRIAAAQKKRWANVKRVKKATAK